MKIVLQKPVIRRNQAGEELATISELNMRDEMVSGDMRGITYRSDGMLHDDLVKIAGRLCAQPDDVMYKLSIPDTTRVLKIVSDFLNGGPGTATEP